MTVYADDANVAPTGGPHTSRWPLFAGTCGELHDFAGALGLRREWFQGAPATWHYDLTWRQGAEIIRERSARPGAARHQSLREQITARLAAAGIGPDDPGVRQWARHNAGLGTGPTTQSPLRDADREAETR